LRRRRPWRRRKQGCARGYAVTAFIYAAHCDQAERSHCERRIKGRRRLRPTVKHSINMFIVILRRCSMLCAQY
ncbi:hypothetical protein BAE44_0015597, partial [Dichanthelium oligosanthes]